MGWANDFNFSESLNNGFESAVSISFKNPPSGESCGSGFSLGLSEWGSGTRASIPLSFFRRYLAPLFGRDFSVIPGVFAVSVGHDGFMTFGEQDDGVAPFSFC